MLKTLHICFYLLLLIPSMFLFAVLWTSWAPDNLYYTSDPFPVLEFIPPFVHESTAEIYYADYYIASKSVTYGVWVLFFVTGLLLPLPMVYFLKKVLMVEK